MKLRNFKHIRNSRLFKVGPVMTVLLFVVSRKKDNTVYTTAVSKQEANAVILKAKAAKKAALYISSSYRQKYARR